MNGPTAVAIVAAVLVGGCSPVVYSVPTSATVATRARSASEIQVFIGFAPRDCPYRDIVYIEGATRAGSPAETMELMRQEAAKHGADALILLDHHDPSGRSGGYGHNYTAVGIAFLHGPCQGTK